MKLKTGAGMIKNLFVYEQKEGAAAELSKPLYSQRWEGDEPPMAADILFIVDESAGMRYTCLVEGVAKQYRISSRYGVAWDWMVGVNILLNEPLE